METRKQRNEDHNVLLYKKSEIDGDDLEALENCEDADWPASRRL